jgi:hypothetical protein
MHTIIERVLRIRTFEILIFIVLFILLALCITITPLIEHDDINAKIWSDSNAPTDFI